MCPNRVKQQEKIAYGLLIANIVMLFYLYHQLQLRVAQDEVQLNKRLDLLGWSLNLTRDDVSNLKYRVSALEQSFNNEILRQRAELKDIRSGFQDLQSQLESYFEWFKSNSKLSGREAERLHDIEDCVSSRIRLPCVWFWNQRKHNIEYKEDISLGKWDFIQNVSFTLDRQGGDCEDLATLLMAEANYLYDEYNLSFESWENSQKDDYPVIAGWVLPDAKLVEVPGGRVYMVCYSQGDTGHCINAVCQNNPMQNHSEIESVLQNCTLIEPQNYAQRVWVSGNSIGDSMYRSPFLGWILVMSGKDLCMREETGWSCFTDFHSRIQDRLANLSKVLNQS